MKGAPCLPRVFRALPFVLETEARRSHLWIWGEGGGNEGDHEKRNYAQLYWLLGYKALSEFFNFSFASRVLAYLVSFFWEGIAKDLVEERLSFVRECEYLLCYNSQNWSFQVKRAPLDFMTRRHIL